MRNSPIKVGLIGAGFISPYHIRGLQQAGAEVVSICGRTESSARARAREFGIPSVAPGPPEILERDDVDAVVIVTPDRTHEELAVASLEAGKAVLLQKPMAPTSDACARILEAAQSTGELLCVSWMHRYFEEVRTTRDLLAEGALGQIYSVRMRNATPGPDYAKWFYRRDDVGGGAILQLGIHGIDLLRYLFGDMEAVCAVKGLLKEKRTMADGSTVVPDNEDFAMVVYRFAEAYLATQEIVFHEVAGTDRFRLEVYGDRGTAWLRSERGRLALYAPEHLGRRGWFEPDLPAEPFGLRQHRHFLNMVRGDEPPDGSARDGYIAVAVAEAAYRSAATDHWQEVKYA